MKKGLEYGNLAFDKEQQTTNDIPGEATKGIGPRIRRERKQGQDDGGDGTVNGDKVRRCEVADRQG
jgi:hypothetical protein